MQICDKIKYPTTLTLLGHSIMATAYILIGPAPFLDGLVSNSVNLAYFVAALIGISWSLVAVSSFNRASRTAMRLGYYDDMKTNLNLAGEFEHLFYHAIQFSAKIYIATFVQHSALWLSSMHLGCFLGPTVSGFVVQAIGFRSTAVTYMVVSLIMFLANLAELGLKLKDTTQDKLDYRRLDVDDTTL